MLDLSLFRVPTFTGAQITAFVISAAMFSQFLYLTLYLQNVLGLSPIAAGRPLPAAVADLVRRRADRRAAVRADPGEVPARRRARGGRRGAAAHARDHAELGLDDAAGGLRRRRHRHRARERAARLDRRQRRAAAAGRDGVGDQQHLPAGRDRDGDRGARRASCRRTCTRSSPGTVAAPFAKAASSGLVSAAAAPPHVTELLTSAYISGLNEILLVAAIVAFVGGALAFVLVRQRDFVAHSGAVPERRRHTERGARADPQRQLPGGDEEDHNRAGDDHERLRGDREGDRLGRVHAARDQDRGARAGLRRRARRRDRQRRRGGGGAEERERERERARHRERVQQQEHRRPAERPRDGDEHPGGARLARAVRVPAEPAAEPEPRHLRPASSRAGAARSRPRRARPRPRRRRIRRARSTSRRRPRPPTRAASALRCRACRARSG